MKKKLIYGLLSSIALFFVLTLVLPAKMGQLTYNFVTKIEAKLSGLKKVKVDIGEMKITLYQNDHESKPTILMLHGFSADKDNWIRFARDLSDNFNLVIPDMPGHGETGFDKLWDYSVPAQAARVVKILEQLNIEKVHIIGNSMGGYIAAQFAKDYPQKTLSATLVDPAGVRSPEPSIMDKMLSQGKNPFEIYNRNGFDKLYAMTMQDPPYIPGFILQSVSEKYQNRREQLMHVFRDFHPEKFPEGSLQIITAPVLLLWGKEDQLIHVSSISTWRKEIKHIQVKIWEDIGHMPMLEIPKKSAKVYRQFIEQL